MYIQGLANFIDDFLGGLMLISYALMVGGMIWCALILRIWQSGHQLQDRREATILSIQLIRLGAMSLAAMQGTKIMTKALLLTSALGELPLMAYASTVQFQAGVLRIALSLALLPLTRRLLNNCQDWSAWKYTLALMVPMVISGAWLVHAVGRFEDKAPLMLLTIIHQLGAAAWFGGVAQLLYLWVRSASSPEIASFWPVAIVRFGWVGVASVSLLIATGIPLSLAYIGSVDGLFGTGYGSLVVTKALMMLMALFLAWRNHKAGKEWRELGHSIAMTKRIPFYIEAETFILVGILFVAATLSSQPPSVDITDTTATVSEVAHMFAPNWPKISSPSHEQLMAGEAGRVAVVNKIPSLAATEWSDYNHNVSGLFLTSMSLVAMLSYFVKWRWTRYWPIGFIGLSLFLFFRSDGETWPLGPIGFWESTFGNGEVFQHRIATLLTFALGALELRARTRNSARNLRFMFPILSAFGGVLLLTHAHAEFELKSEFLIQTTHTTMGLLSVIIAAGRWLELRLATTEQHTAHAQAASNHVGQVAGFISATAMLLIGLLLMFYREPLF
ncbi:MAG: hypothetical protein RIQ52_1318 [Pseudomonadota bacterium]|jgi:putative copper resistance protein D